MYYSFRIVVELRKYQKLEIRSNSRGEKISFLIITSDGNSFDADRCQCEI